MNTNSENIKVVVRCRPFSQDEQKQGFKCLVEIISKIGQVKLKKNDKDLDPKVFQFNSAYSWDSNQTFIYDDIARPIVEAVLDGFNGTVFAYGQTGTGKTYTMEGVIQADEHKGVILHAFDHIFAHISNVKDKEFLVRASFLQIYKEDVFDLLGDPDKKLHVRQLDNDVSVLGLSTHIVKSPKEITSLLLAGKEKRAVGATAMNKQSSRSHSVFTIIVEQHSEKNGTRMGKLHLVDLAGSERLKKTEAVGERAKEAAKINQSLLTLGNVISALVTGSKHVPYRDSKLTQLLYDSLGGNSKTAMIATIGPADYNYEETLSTLLYATRARDIKNIPKYNMDPKDAILGQLRDKIAELKRQLELQQSQAAANGIIINNNDIFKDIEQKHQDQLNELMNSKNMNEEERIKAKKKLEEEYEKQKSAQQETELLQQKIKQIEQSVLVGGVNLVDKAKQQEELIRANESKIRRREEEQKRLDQKKKIEEEKIILVEKKYSSLKEEYEEKSKQISKLKPLIKHLEDSIDDIQQQFEREKEEQTNHIKELNKELLYLNTIANNFIPENYLNKILSLIVYNETDQKPTLLYLDQAGRHQKIILEDLQNKIYIEGLDEQLDFTNSSDLKIIPSEEEKKINKERQQKAVSNALNEMALVTKFVKKIKQ